MFYTLIINNERRSSGKKERQVMRRLNKKTIQRYSVEKIANHVDNYQNKINVDEYRFDFQFKTIYTKAGSDYYYFMDMLDTDFNKMMIESILESVYRLHDIQVMEHSIKQMKKITG
jgi:hypothetical protein